ncbi:DUF3617 family protein [soil metagenome]
MRLHRLLRTATALVIVFPAFAAASAEIELPARKPGLWELKMIPETAGAAPQITMQLCLDAATDKDIMAAGLAMSGNACTTKRSQSGGSIQFDADCNFGDRHTVSQTTISGDFQASYTLKIVSDSQGGNPALPKHSVVTQQATWLGACTPGLLPGEMMMPGGRKVNVLGTLKKPGG